MRGRGLEAALASVELAEEVDGRCVFSFVFSFSLRRLRNARGFTFSLSSRTMSSSDFSDFAGEARGTRRACDEEVREVDALESGIEPELRECLEDEALDRVGGAGTCDDLDEEEADGVEYKAFVNASIRAKLGVTRLEESIADRASSSSVALFPPVRDCSKFCRVCWSPVFLETVVEELELPGDCISCRKLTLTVVVALEI